MLAKLARSKSRLLCIRHFSDKPVKPTYWAPGRDHVPTPNPPRRMVEEKPPPKGLRGMIRQLFEGKNSQMTFADRQKAAITQLGGADSEKAPQEKLQYLHAKSATHLLYWYCTDLTFAHSDFERIGPPGIQFKVTRARNPVNLTPWMGYFLEFNNREDAMKYYEETIGHELCGFPLKLKFTEPDIRGFHSPLLDKAPGLPRRAHVLVLGLPVAFPPQNIPRVLWDYDLLDNDRLAVERMPLGDVKYGGNPFVLRFKTEKEAARFVRDHHGEVFPYTDNKVLCHVVD